MVSSNERQSKIRRRLCWPQCGSLDNILGLLFSGSLGNSVQQCSSPFCRGGIRYQKRPPTVRNWHSVRKTASCGTRRIFRGIRCKKQASTVRKRYSVHRTGSYGTVGFEKRPFGRSHPKRHPERCPKSHPKRHPESHPERHPRSPPKQHLYIRNQGLKLTLNP